ncbi:hypothetical protein NM688_g1857 [Phlebia brevispora]|uniref:Uncharacterized protein n=1 Tax=Phlebia brevispora TaxID=194682 RepID=A0ACC1TA46_9APHY|nr:hypothetical protein NM688_g1857 [Phlebia brevispora]
MDAELTHRRAKAFYVDLNFQGRSHNGWAEIVYDAITMHGKLELHEKQWFRGLKTIYSTILKTPRDMFLAFYDPDLAWYRDNNNGIPNLRSGDLGRILPLVRRLAREVKFETVQDHHRRTVVHKADTNRLKELSSMDTREANHEHGPTNSMHDVANMPMILTAPDVQTVLAPTYIALSEETSSSTDTFGDVSSNLESAGDDEQFSVASVQTPLPAALEESDMLLDSNMMPENRSGPFPLFSVPEDPGLLPEMLSTSSNFADISGTVSSINTEHITSQGEHDQKTDIDLDINALHVNSDSVPTGSEVMNQPLAHEPGTYAVNDKVNAWLNRTELPLASHAGLNPALPSLAVAIESSMPLQPRPSDFLPMIEYTPTAHFQNHSSTLTYDALDPPDGLGIGNEHHTMLSPSTFPSLSQRLLASDVSATAIGNAGLDTLPSLGEAHMMLSPSTFPSLGQRLLASDVSATAIGNTGLDTGTVAASVFHNVAGAVPPLVIVPNAGPVWPSLGQNIPPSGQITSDMQCIAPSNTVLNGRADWPTSAVSLDLSLEPPADAGYNAQYSPMSTLPSLAYPSTGALTTFTANVAEATSVPPMHESTYPPMISPQPPTQFLIMVDLARQDIHLNALSNGEIAIVRNQEITKAASTIYSNDTHTIASSMGVGVASEALPLPPQPFMQLQGFNYLIPEHAQLLDSYSDPMDLVQHKFVEAVQHWYVTLRSHTKEALQLYVPLHAHQIMLHHLKNIEEYTCVDVDVCNATLAHAYPGGNNLGEVALCVNGKRLVEVIASIDHNPLLPMASVWSTHLMNAIGPDIVISTYPTLTLNKRGVISTDTMRHTPNAIVPRMQTWKRYLDAGFVITAEPTHSVGSSQQPAALQSPQKTRRIHDEHTLIMKGHAVAQRAIDSLQTSITTKWNIGGYVYTEDDLKFIQPSAKSVPPQGTGQLGAEASAPTPH